ncbi:MAG: hydrogenase maturation protease [Thiohalocapsa sp.]
MTALRIEAVAPVAPTLVFGIGNPSRGDDALGPMMIQRLEREHSAGRLPGVDLLTDFQLQPEHALDLRGRARVIFVDASLQGSEPYRLLPACAHAAATSGNIPSSTHSTSPEGLLLIYRQLYGEPPLATLMAVRGYDFALGAEPCTGARDNLAAALAALLRWLSQPIRCRRRGDGLR